MILDGNNLGMRSFHAANGSMSSGGMETGALHLFVQSLSMHVRAERPDRLFVAWDGGYVVRQQLYPDYKAGRRAAAAALATGDPGAVATSAEPHHRLFWMIRQFLKLANIGQALLPGTEADDLIAAAWRLYHHTERVLILSSDKDMLQLLDENTEQIRFSSASAPTDRWNRTRVITELGYKPEQIPLMMALTGDTSDGVPGMRGIGPKKAFKMLSAAGWDLDRAMEPYPEHYSIVKTSQALVDLLDGPVRVTSPPVQPLAPTTRASDPERWGQLLDFCDAYELATIRKRLVDGELWL